MIALSAIAAKAWKPLAIAAVVGLILGGVFFYGYTHGQASRQPEIDTLTTKMAGLQAQNEALAAAAVRQNAEAEKARQQAEFAKHLADGAVDELKRTQARADKAKSEFEAKLKAASKTPDCAMLKELACPAVPFPY